MTDAQFSALPIYTINYTELTNIVEEENLRQLQSDEAIVVSDEDSVSYPS